MIDKIFKADSNWLSNIFIQDRGHQSQKQEEVTHRVYAEVNRSADMHVYNPILNHIIIVYEKGTPILTL